MDFLLVFLMGGFLSAVAQLLIDKTALTPARILVMYVVCGVLIGAFGFYTPLKDLFGAGISVPLIGFGGNVAEGVKKAVDTDGAIGILTGALTASAGGIGAALVFGYFTALIAKGSTKRA